MQGGLVEWKRRGVMPIGGARSATLERMTAWSRGVGNARDDLVLDQRRGSGEGDIYGLAV
ncbi:hypothetical protein D0B32_19690 [Paraburkholderia sp. DHOC27]|nr:hypothetical protein D0B32_19690 [Paraburkholderia sp. DHOC27]